MKSDKSSIQSLIASAGLFILAMLAVGTAAAGGGGAPGPVFFETPTDSAAQVAGSQFSSRNSLGRTLIYLHLSGRFTDAHEELFNRYLNRDGSSPEAYSANPILEWRELVEAATGDDSYLGTRKLITREQTVDGRSFTTRHYFDNCTDEAFSTAVSTYRDREARYGEGTEALRRWLDAQRQVFSNCADTEAVIPAEPDPGWPQLQQQDRAYQIAASQFYAMNYRQAADRFALIAEDTASPWARISRYLVARSLKQESQYGEGDSEAALREALTHYQSMAGEPGYLAEFPSIAGLIRYIEIKLDTAGFLRNAAETLLVRPGAMDLGTLDDFLFLTGNANTGAAAPGDPLLLEWHRLSADKSGMARDRIRANWRTTGSPAWLYLALSREELVAADALDDYIEGFSSLEPATPARTDMQIMLARLASNNGYVEQALDLATDMLNNHAPNLSRTQLNAARHLVAENSTEPTDYLARSPLPPSGVKSAYWYSFEDEAGLRQATRGAELFPDQTIDRINFYYTPDMLLDAVDTVEFNAYLRGRLIIAAWVKALLLEDSQAARRSALLLRDEFPSIRPELDQFLSGDNSDYIAAHIIVTHPGFSPWIPRGLGRFEYGSAPVRYVFPATTVALGQRSHNWWCTSMFSPTRSAVQTTAQLRQQPMFSTLPEQQLEEMLSLHDRLDHSVGEFFGPTIIDYARANPGDERAAQSLHRVVFAARHACESGPGEVSQAAFETLHRLWPDSEWAEQTPYWYEF